MRFVGHLFAVELKFATSFTLLKPYSTSFPVLSKYQCYQYKGLFLVSVMSVDHFQVAMTLWENEHIIRAHSIYFSVNDSWFNDKLL